MWPFNRPARSTRPAFVNTIPTPVDPDTLPLTAREIESRVTAQRLLIDTPLYNATLLPEAGYDDLIVAGRVNGYGIWQRDESSES